MSPRYPTLEFRICDICPRWDDAVAIASMARTIVAAAVEGRLSGFPSADGMGAAALALLRHENEWYAARDGLDATFADPGAPGGARVLRESVVELLDGIGATADALSTADALEGVRTILERGNGAERMRAQARDHGGDLPSLVGWLASDTALGVGIDRRTAQRER